MKFEIKSFYLRNSLEGVDLILVENYIKERVKIIHTERFLNKTYKIRILKILVIIITIVQRREPRVNLRGSDLREHALELFQSNVLSRGHSQKDDQNDYDLLDHCVGL